VRRIEFERHPTVTAYRCVADTAGAVGVGDPTSWALTVPQGRVTQQPVYAPELVAVLLAIGHDEQAWLAGLEHRQWVDERQWLSLLERRGDSPAGGRGWPRPFDAKGKARSRPPLWQQALSRGG
jgi:hypothetical protein